MRDHLAMLTFEKRVLLPGIRVSLDEVRAYYREHQADFQLPETLDLCLISGEERSALDVFCAAFPAGRKTPRSDLLVQCLEVRGDEVPPPWNKDTSRSNRAPAPRPAARTEAGRPWRWWNGRKPTAWTWPTPIR